LFGIPKGSEPTCGKGKRRENDNFWPNGALNIILPFGEIININFPEIKNINFSKKLNN
jgi:hypothetical protein